MSDDFDNKDGDLQDDIKAVADKLNVDINLFRDISPEEIQYLLNLCPFLQIVDTVLHYIGDDLPPDVQFIKARSGWTILDYGDAMSTSPGKKILGLTDEEDEAGKGGRGTIWYQAWVTAMEMIEIAKMRGWAGIQVIDGHRLMKRAAWVKASNEGLPVVGFEPSENDVNVRNLVDMPSSEFEVFRHQIRS